MTQLVRGSCPRGPPLTHHNVVIPSYTFNIQIEEGANRASGNDSIYPCKGQRTRRKAGIPSQTLPHSDLPENPNTYDGALVYRDFETQSGPVRLVEGSGNLHKSFHPTSASIVESISSDTRRNLRAQPTRLYSK